MKFEQGICPKMEKKIMLRKDNKVYIDLESIPSAAT
jgi:hypothetical protein